MSFLPPGSSTPTELADSALAQQRERELEAKAARYAQLHSGEGNRAGAGAVRRAIRRLHAAMRRRS